MADDDLDKTEAASDRKREEMRRKGKVFHSTEVSSTSVYIVIVITLFFSAGKMTDAMVAINRKVFLMAGDFSFNSNNIRYLFIDMVRDMGFVLLPLFAVGIVIALAANVMQVGFLLTAEPFEFDLGKINVVEGMQRFVSKKMFFELVKTVVKLGLVGYVTYVWLKDEISTLLVLPNMPPSDIISFIGDFLWKLSIPVSILMVAIAVIDFAFQKYDYEQSIRMSKHDIREELKQQEGDPKLKGRVKAIQREMSMNRMMREIPNATAVVTNPTHIAVAIKYDQEDMDAPVLVAKGEGFVAEKIKELAREHNVPLVEDKPLARMLFKHVKLGELIPEKMYKAVAEVLAYVYKLKKVRGSKQV